MDLSEIEKHFLLQFEESNEELHMLENDVRLHFSSVDENSDSIRNRVRNTIRKLYDSGLIDLRKFRYRKVRRNHFEVVNAVQLPDSDVDRLLNNSRSWDRDFQFHQTEKYYFQPTDKGIECLDSCTP